MKNYIGLNIKYLCENNFLSQDEFGEKFGLKKSVIGTYIRGISIPKIELIQKICLEFNLTLDTFVNNNLYLKESKYPTETQTQYNVQEAGTEYYTTEKEALQKTIQAQEETIAAMKITIDVLLQKTK